jgi:hypothetical protein
MTAASPHESLAGNPAISVSPMRPEALRLRLAADLPYEQKNRNKRLTL